MGLSVGTNGLNLIKQYEGCKLTSYQDSVGVWTIGYGHTSGVTQGMTITQAQADAYLKQDCSNAESAVNKYYTKYNWNQNQFDALVSFAFNIGNIKQLTADGTRTNAVIAEKILEYNKAGGKKLQGLVNRRTAERKLFLTAVSGSSSTSSSSSVPSYTTGKTYTTQVELKVRKGAGTNYTALKHSQLTSNAQSSDKDKDGALDKGTKITCKGTAKDASGNIWMKIPSGYIAAYYDGKTYVK